MVLITHSVEEALLLGTRVLVMSPRPGRVVLDLPLPFAESDRASADLRADPHFVAAGRHVRDTIAGGIP